MKQHFVLYKGGYFGFSFNAENFIENTGNVLVLSW